jgi:hypothetical protein
VDLAAIDAIGVETIQVVMSEYGPDLSRFATEKQFTSHITLTPNRPVSGGKPVKKKKRGGASTRVAAALRMAALSLRHSETALGAYYRQIARRIGGDVASLPQHGSWPRSSTGYGGDNPTSTKVPKLMKSDIRNAASAT